MLSCFVLVDRPPKEQFNEQRWVELWGPDAIDGSLFGKYLSGGLRDAVDPRSKLGRIAVFPVPGAPVRMYRFSAHMPDSTEERRMAAAAW